MKVDVDHSEDRVLVVQGGDFDLPFCGEVTMLTSDEVREFGDK